MKKKVLKIAIALFWGVSLPWMIIYALLEMMYLINKSKQGDSYSELEENKKLFFIVLAVPFVSILLLFIGGPSRFLVLISLYGFLYTITLTLILFTDKGFTAFNRDYKKLLTDFKEFGIFLLINFLLFLIIGIIYAIQPSLAYIATFPFELIISVMACGVGALGLRKFQLLYPQIKNNEFVYTDNDGFLTVSPRNPEEIKSHIAKLEHFASDLAKTKDKHTTLTYYRNLVKKSLLAIKIFQNERNKIEIAKYRQKHKNFLQIVLKLENEIFKAEYKQISLEIKELKAKGVEKKAKQIHRLYSHLLDISNKRLKIVSKHKLEQERQEVLKKIKFIKKGMNLLPK